MKKMTKLTALLLVLAILLPTLVGCFGTGGNGGDDPADGFNPPYLENYYVNKHTPVAKKGVVEVHKYESEQSYSFTVGGHDYHGGVVLQYDYGTNEHFDVEFPLEGQYDYFSFVLGGDFSKNIQDSNGNDTYSPVDFAMEGAYPTLNGKPRDMKVALQFIIDGKIAEEIVLSCYDVAKRYTYDVKGAESFEVKAVSGDDFLVPMMEITVWNGEAHETGYVPESAGNDPVKLVRDLKPYLIPNNIDLNYYPNAASNERNYINMNAVRFEDAIAASVSEALVQDEEKCVFFDLEGKYNYLTFTAGAADRETTYDEGTVWLTVYADDEILMEELISTHDLYRRFTLDVTGCRQLKFAWLLKEGNQNFGTSTGGIYGLGDAYVATTKEAFNTITYSSRELPNRPVKMVSELGTFGVFSNLQQAVFDGSSSNVTFSMGGVKYNEGIMLYTSNSLFVTKPATASFNLDGKYKTISFITGHISNSNVYENDQIEIYADGVLIKTIDMKFHMIPQEHILDVTGCKHLEFVSGKQTLASMERPAYGIAELVAYPDGYVETDLFHKRTPADFGKTCDLIDTFGFYDVYNSIISKKLGAVSWEDGYYDGTTQKNTFTVGDKTYNKGILLRTSVHLELDMAGLGGAVTLGSMFGGWGWAILAFADAGEAHESSFAMANIKDSGYTSVTFTVAMQQDNTSLIVQDETKLMIGADDESVWETTLYKDMPPTEFTVEIGECDRLMFWLNCGEEDMGSHTYAIYNITLNK